MRLLRVDYRIDAEKTAAAQLRFVTSLRDALTRQRGHVQSFSARA
jgi:hypothetical protein